jgi:hypothetical protein
VPKEIQWSRTVDQKHYDSAFSYLSLKYDPVDAMRLVKKFKAAKITTRHAADILRASQLKPLKEDDPGVQKEEKKLEDGKDFAPVLVLNYHVWTDIADGYHRTSYAYHLDPFTDVAVKIVNYES